MLVERIDELSLQHHDFGGSANALLGGFVRRIDRLKAELIGADDYAAWAAELADGGIDAAQVGTELEFARGLPGARADARARPGPATTAISCGDALRLVREQPGGRRPLRARPDRRRAGARPRAAASLARALAGQELTVAGDPDSRRCAASGAPAAPRLRSFENAG